MIYLLYEFNYDEIFKIDLDNKELIDIDTLCYKKCQPQHWRVKIVNTCNIYLTFNQLQFEYHDYCNIFSFSPL